MSENQRPQSREIDPKYMRMARSLVLRPLALGLTRDAVTSVLEASGAEVDLFEMRRRYSNGHSEMESSYLHARSQCEKGDEQACEIMDQREAILGGVIQEGDILSNGQISEMSAKLEPNLKLKIMPYIEE